MLNLSNELHAEGFNPFSGVKPSFGPFTDLLSSKLGIFLGLVWAIAFIYAAFHIVQALARVANSQKGGYGGDMSDAKRDLGMAAASVVGLAALPAIWIVLIN